MVVVFWHNERDVRLGATSTWWKRDDEKKEEGTGSHDQDVSRSRDLRLESRSDQD